MGATETELVRLQRRKWLWLSHALRGWFVVVSGSLGAAIADNSTASWLGFTVTLVGTTIQVVDRWFAEGPLVLRKGDQTIILEPGKDVSKDSP